MTEARSEAIDAAIARGLAFLEGAQDASGEIPVFTVSRRDMEGPRDRDPSIFPTALAAQALAFVAQAAGVRARALDFLERERLPGGLWSHWPRSNPLASSLPPDLDDTSCASQALRAAGRQGGAPSAVLLANRRPDGLFQTWIIPRIRHVRPGSIGRTLRRAMRPVGLIFLFTKTSARPGDVDAVVNANTLFHLGSFAGDDRVIAYLRRVLETGSESQSDKWYESAHVVRYFLARALAAAGCPSPELFARRADADPPQAALALALDVSMRLTLGLAVPPDAIPALVEAQRDDGSWPAAAIYFGGRKRVRGGFAPAHPDTPHWGSEAMTTVFALEALARWRARTCAGEA